MIELNLENIELEKEYKWKQLCETLEEPYTNGNTRVKKLKELSSLCRFTKVGQKYIIHEIYDTPKEIVDKRKGRKIINKKQSKYEGIITHNEILGKFDGFYVYAHYINEEVVYIGKGCRHRAISDISRNYNMKEITKIKIIKRFGDNEIEALAYEKEMIEHYKSIGQCKYNDNIYHEGKTKTDNTDKKILNKIDKLIERKELMMKKIDSINDEINKLYEQLTKK